MKSNMTNMILLMIIFLVGITELKGQIVDSARSANQRYFKYCFDNVYVIKDIPYGMVVNHDGEEEELRLDIYTPEDDQILKRRVIVWFHGGGFKPGNDKNQSYIATLCQAFARKGYLCIAPNYRLRSNPASDMSGTLDDAIHDVELSLKWIRRNCKNYRIDPKCVIVGGGSAGGILMSNFCFRKDNACKRLNIKAFISLWGSPDNLTLNPVFYRPPTIFIHGTNDPIVPFQNSEHLASGLSRTGVYCELHPLVGALHTPVARMEEIISLITDFLRRPEINIQTKQ